MSTFIGVIKTESCVGLDGYNITNRPIIRDGTALIFNTP